MAQKPVAPLIHLDTHVVCWLYAGDVERLSVDAHSAIEGGRLGISPMVELELEYLREIGRLLVDPAIVVGSLANELGLAVSQTSFPAVVARAREIDWTRDPFDRLIAAQAQADGARLVTKDKHVRECFAAALW
ncbi:type II toxin-antitoxin system VapC family toxin [Rhodocyclaceae bacterium SMB388]